MVKRKILIFDFDGTIADTKAIYYKTISNQLKVFGYSYKKVDKAIDLGMSLKRTLKRLGFSFIISWFVHRRVMKEVEKEVEKVKKCKDVNSIKDIKGEKIVVSNSLKEFILPIIKQFKLKRCFKEFYGAEDFSDKSSFIKNYLKEKKVRKENCYYIGDRAADIKIAKKVGCKSVVIAGKCAWNSKKELLREKPDFIISSIRELKKIIA
jgi:phosphoglycolate phosphatase-like HAD superfamily hydrolase